MGGSGVPGNVEEESGEDGGENRVGTGVPRANSK